ncbi:polycystic kidney disease 2-like 2 protein [Stylophora pistillata]|uniref:polycystic kidney disease 2-like 2 protein n=1 Tax=Stylophora pistillata TaxID=50429 RepID=UPI000C052C65|nr:polycystic kidney disease 2-like 2 protein [Stylophora pistillata]
MNKDLISWLSSFISLSFILQVKNPVHRFKFHSSNFHLSESCQVVKETKCLFKSCIGPYSLEAEDKTQLYQPRWRPLLSQNISAETLNKVCPKPWRYSTAEQTKSLPFWGKLYPLYSQGGYLAELGYDRNSATKVISDLNRLNWFDKYTSAVLIEFTVFNSRVSLFSAVRITVEFSPSGYVASDHVIHPLHVYNTGAGYSAAHLVCQILFILFIVYFVFKETKEMIQQPKHYFRRFLNWIELAQILTAISFAVSHIFKGIELSLISSKLHENVFQFISFDKAVLLDDMETPFLALLMFFNTLKLLYLFRFNCHVKRLSQVMKASFLGLVNCSVGFYVFAFAFAHFGFIQFGRELEEYSSLLSAFQSLLGQVVVGNRAAHLQDCHDVIGPLFFIVFNMCLQVIWLNIFIAILIHEHKTALQFFKGRFNLGKFMIRKIKETLHCIRDRKLSPKRLGNKRKKRVHWEDENDAVELDNNNNDIGSSKRTECKSQDASSKELEKCITVMSLKLNDLYTDEFIEDIEDIELLNLWVDACARGRNVSEERRAGTQSEGVAQARKMKSRAP